VNLDVLPGSVSWQLRAEHAAHDTLVLHLAGRWTSLSRPPLPADVLGAARMRGPVARIIFDTERLGAWDTGLLVFLRALEEEARRSGIHVMPDALPDSVRRLLRCRSDLERTIQEVGIDALLIVALISLLVGVILGYVGGTAASS
jgi:hypothetical protein